MNEPEAAPHEDFFEHYLDTGCKESRTCLGCHLERCIHDAPVQRRKDGWAQQDTERANAVVVAERTMPRPAAITKVANDYGITERTVWRILQRVGNK